MALNATLLVGCGADQVGGGGSTDVAIGDGSIAQDGATVDSGEADDDGAANDGVGLDVAAGDTAGDAGLADTIAVDVTSPDVTGADALTPDATTNDATPTDAAATLSCKGTPDCSVYLLMNDLKQCANDPGCAVVGKTCIGTAQALNCAQAPSEAACKTTKGCSWNDCQLTNKGVEACDGLDNDCDGVTDNPTGTTGAICEDGDKCNGVEVCVQGQCQAGMGLKCEPKACHDASCDKTSGCTYAANSAACDDNDPCTDKDVCAGGACKGGAAKSCDDGDTCTTDSCDPKTGVCSSKNDGIGGCDDKNPCTDDACDAKTGCSHTNNTKACDDGDACTSGVGGGKGKAVGSGDLCAAGKCVPGAKVVCDDGNPCTDDSCDANKGCIKLNNSIACDDKNACTKSEKCAAGVCGGGASKCDDADVCTADSCDATTGGTCKNTAITGCKACTQAAGCDDKNACTKDACAAGKCAYTKITGCIGPTDYAVISLIPKVSPIPLPGGAVWFLTVRNDGLAYGGSYPGILAYKLMLSADNKVDSGDKLLYANKWSGYNISGTKIPEATITVGISIQDTTLVAGKKFVCVVLSGGGDTNLTNNTKCIPLAFVLPNFTATSLTVIGQTLTANATGYVDFAFKNTGTKANAIYAQFFASKDGTLDDKDVLSHPLFQLAATNPGETKTYKYTKITIGKTIQEDFKFLCVRINTQLDAWKKESNPNDNTICVPAKFSNPPNLTIVPTHVAFRDKTGKLFANVPYGGEYACYMSQIANSSYGNAAGGWPVRCWLSDTGATPYGGVWAVTHTHKTPILGAQVAKPILGTTYMKLEPPTIGVRYICGDMNHDKSIVETSYANKACRKIAVTGMDMFVDAAKSKYGAPSWKVGQPTVIQRGVDLTVEYVYCNQGNVALNAKANGLSARMLLSKDKIPSADDHVIWQTTQFGFNQLNGLNAYGQPSCGAAAYNSPKHKLPLTMAAGTYYLLMDVNADKKYPEPMANNLVVKTLTVQ
mgnify:CR=1 FL=1